MGTSRVEPGDSTHDRKPPNAHFKPSDSEQRSLHSYYRGCWHEFSRSFFRGMLITPGINRRLLLSPESGLQLESLHPAHSVALSGLRPLQKILDCSLP